MIELILGYFGIKSLLTILVIFLVYKFSVRTFDLEEKLGFAGPKPLPFIGNFLDVLRNGYHENFVNFKKKYGDIYPLYLGSVRSLIISDQEVLKQILVKDFKNFIDRPKQPAPSKLAKLNLLRLRGKDWVRVRSLLTPTFTSGKLKKMSPMILVSIQNMKTQFEKFVGKPVNTAEIFQSLTMEVIAKTMFGIEMDTFNDASNPFMKYARQILQASILSFFFIADEKLPEVMSNWFPDGIFRTDAIRFFRKSLERTIKIRKESKEDYHDFLALMLKAHEEQKLHMSDEVLSGNTDKTMDSEPENYKKLSEEEIMAQSFIFLLAGYETTASTLTFASYFLATNPDIQEEIYQEILDVVGDKEDISYDDLSSLTLVDQCIQETLRICPPVTQFGRLCNQSTQVKTSTGRIFTIPKNTLIFVPIYVVHHDSKNYKNPETFDIHRFDSENKQKHNPITYLPFGYGPRSCIGMRFALLEAKLSLFYLLKNFKLSPCSETPDKLEFRINRLTQVKKPIIVKVEKR